MKSQDILLLLKLESMRHRELSPSQKQLEAWPHDWHDWLELNDADSFWDEIISSTDVNARYSNRSLEGLTGISKSQINLSLHRCFDSGLARPDRKSGVPRANAPALYDFIVYGLKYVFPVKPGTLTRGIATAYGAPVLQKDVLSAGELKLVWPYAEGKSTGLSIEPLTKSVNVAIRNDPELYAMLALVDAIRIGQPRESQIAQAKLKQILL